MHFKISRRDEYIYIFNNNKQMLLFFSEKNDGEWRRGKVVSSK